MSKWTHITACFSVDTYHCTKRLCAYVRRMLKEAPKITGSEGDAEIFVNHKEGVNVYMSHDCNHCEYKSTLRTDPENADYDICDAPDKYDCSAEYQTCVVISIQGDLRDKTKVDTEIEFAEFKEFLEKRFFIRDYCVNIQED